MELLGLTCKRWREADVLFGLVELVLNLRAVALVLAHHSLALPQRLQGTEDLQLVPEDLFTAVLAPGKSYGEQGHDLSHVVLQHVSDHPVLVVVGNTTLKQKWGDLCYVALP